MELLVVVVIISILVGLLFPAIRQAMLKAEAAKARTTILSIATAFKAFNSEYSRWPSSVSSTDPLTLNTNLFNSANGNARNIVFLDTASKDIDSSGNILDPWKNPYQIAFDVTYANSIPNPLGGTPNPIPAGVIVWSVGPDGQSDTSGDSSVLNMDNIKSW